MKLKLKKGGLLINALVAIAISLVANFSYLVMIILSSGSTSGTPTATYQGRYPRHVSPADSIGFVTIETFYYFLLAFILLLIFTVTIEGRKNNSSTYWKRLLIGAAITIGLYFFAPYLRRSGQIVMIMSARRVFNPMIILKCSFTLVVAALYGKIYELLNQKQNITLENERLRNENLQSRYDVLVNQVNPHFFFNSLNSLSMLVREEKNSDALDYIDRLSDTFRYILETGRRNITTLGEELKFAEDYKYLFEIRYAGKFFIDINVDEQHSQLTLPSLSLQPLIENAVKHNVITKAQPLTITITADDTHLIVSNKIAEKLGTKEQSTGIGLKNLSSRYKLLTGNDIEVIDNGTTFTVKLPLQAQ